MSKKEKVLCPYYNSWGIICNIYNFFKKIMLTTKAMSNQNKKGKAKATLLVAFA